MEAFLLTTWGLLILGIIGEFAHFLKKNIGGETVTDIAGYFHDHFKSTLLATIATVVSIVAYKMSLATGQPADILAAFLLGFGFDSTLNKWEQKAAQ